MAKQTREASVTKFATWTDLEKVYPDSDTNIIRGYRFYADRTTKVLYADPEHTLAITNSDMVASFEIGFIIVETDETYGDVELVKPVTLNMSDYTKKLYSAIGIFIRKVEEKDTLSYAVYKTADNAK